jgi:hypothetical protein
MKLKTSSVELTLRFLRRLKELLVQFLYPRFSLLTKTLRLLCGRRGRDILIRIFAESQGQKPFVLFQISWLGLRVVSQVGILKFRL